MLYLIELKYRKRSPIKVENERERIKHIAVEVLILTIAHNETRHEWLTHSFVKVRVKQAHDIKGYLQKTYPKFYNDYFDNK